MNLAGTDSTTRVCLSLCQRERTKVRDARGVAHPERTKSLPTQYRALHVFDGSKTVGRQFLCSQEKHHVSRPAFCQMDSRDPIRPAQSRVSPPDSRNRRCSDQSRAVAETYSRQNCDSAAAATTHARRRSRFSGEHARDSLERTFSPVAERAKAKTRKLRPSPQSSPRQRGEAVSSNE